MTKLAVITPAVMARILRHLGFELIRQKGSHAYYRHADGRATVLPIHREDLRRGLIRAILRDLELSIEEFETLRREV